MPVIRRNDADILRELEGSWELVLTAIMRKYNLKEVVILPEDLEFMAPPFAQSDGKQPELAAIGLRDALPRGGFILALSYGRDEAIDRLARHQREVREGTFKL